MYILATILSIALAIMCIAVIAYVAFMAFAMVLMLLAVTLEFVGNVQNAICDAIVAAFNHIKSAKIFVRKVK